MDPDGEILIYACSGGKGKAKGKNLANDLHQLVPGVCIHSATQPTNVEKIEIQSGGHLKVKFWDGEDYQPGCPPG